MSLPGSPWFDPGLPPPTYPQIMELVDRSVHEDADSRTAAVKLKRHRGDGSQRGSSRGSSKQSTPRKRMKYSGSAARQDIADFVPNGANFSASNLDTDMDHEAGFGELDNATKSGTQDPSNQAKSTEEITESSTLRSANIRLEIPVARHPGEIPSVAVIAPGLMHKSSSIAVKENGAYVRAFEKALTKRRTLLVVSAKARDKGRERSISQTEKDLHRTEINLAWCQYYPLNCEWRPPKVPPTPGSTPNGLTGTQKFWLIVELCFLKGTLPDLRAGQFGNFTNVSSGPYEQAIANEQDIQSARERYYSCAERLKSSDSTSSTDLLRNELAIAEVDIMYCIFYPKSRTYESLDTWRHLGSEVSNTEPSLHCSAAQLWSLVRHCMSTKQLPDLREGRLGELDENGDDLLTTPEHGPSVAQGRRSPSSEVNSEVSDLGDCGYDADNGHASSTNSSEYDNRSDVEVYDSGDDDTQMSVSQNSDVVVTNIGEDDEEYSQSDSVQAVEEGSNNRDDSDADMETKDTYPHFAQGTGRDPDTEASEKARTLAELFTEDLNAQVRYFHIPMRADDVSRSSLVRCLTCGAKGHMAPECEMLDCTACGAFNDHITADCPLNVKCPKCRAPGHIEETCSSKLQMPREDITCDLCNCRGHVEEDCELFWRTSGAPWNSKLPLGQIRVSCYECGLTGHLGNECPSRQPRKPMGTSSWSILQDGPTPTSFGNSELKPPERATKKPKIFNPSKSKRGDEEDRLVIPSNPHIRAKTPAAGKIRINIANDPKPSATNAPVVNALVNEKKRKGANKTKKTPNQAIVPPTQPPIRWEDIPRTLGAPPQMGQWAVINAYPGTHNTEASHSSTANGSYGRPPPLPLGRPPPLPAAVQTYQQGHQYNHTQHYGWRQA